MWWHCVECGEKWKVKKNQKWKTKKKHNLLFFSGIDGALGHMSLVCGQQSSELRVHCHQHDELHSVASSGNKLTHTLLRFNLLGKRQLCWYHVRPHRMHAEHKCGLLLQPTTWFMCPCVYLFACWPQPWSTLKPTNRSSEAWTQVEPRNCVLQCAGQNPSHRRYCMTVPPQGQYCVYSWPVVEYRE